MTEQVGTKLRWRLHEGQMRALRAPQRFVVVLAGTQGGKTSFGPLWLLREIQRCGPGDYMIVTPTYKLSEAKLLPEFLRLFEEQLRLGSFEKSHMRFRFSKQGERKLFGSRCAQEPTRVLFGYAEKPESLESATIKAAWCDEAGQKGFKLDSWEAILRRLSLAQGRVLITTTPYELGWMKPKLYDPWKRGERPDTAIINFPSITNPAFPKEEFERAKREMPGWKFALFYLGKFTRPAGAIYDNFEPERDTCEPFPIPNKWRRYLGLDFGGVNTAGMFYALEPGTGRLYAYREYHAGGRTASQHAQALLAGEPGIPIAYGGAASEDQWRSEFAAAGLPVGAPSITSVEVGIDRVYAAHADLQIRVFSSLERYLDEKANYSREVDELGQVTEKIDDKSSFHLMDAERYIISEFRESLAFMTTDEGYEAFMGGVEDAWQG